MGEAGIYLGYPEEFMRKIKGFKCVRCKGEFRLNQAEYVCPSCGGNLQVVYDYAFIKKTVSREYFNKNRDLSVWRYLPVLPIKDLKNIPVVNIGWTPLYKADRLGKKLGLAKLYIKDDGKNPSASFKDRAGSVALKVAMEKGEKVITGASTGNAASSLSCLAAALGIRTIIFVPQTAPVAKIAQLLVFGATVITVKGTYDDAFDLCLKATAEYGWYNRNTGYNPYTREGKKTCSLEICEQMNWQPPDKVFVPVGDGNIISGIWKGFRDFHALGLIRKLPQLVAVQAEKSDAVKRAVESDGVIRPVSGDTVADSISVSLPRDGDAAVQAVRESKGFALSVKDSEILEAIKTVARGSSIFGEPAGVTAYAGLEKAVQQGLVGKKEKIVCLMTGNGLKDINSAMKVVGQPYIINPDLGELKKLVKTIGK